MKQILKHAGGVYLYLAMVGCKLVVANDPRGSEVDNFKGFLEAVASGNDQVAETYLSHDAQTALTPSCPGGSISACLDSYGRQQWGNLQEVFWQFGLSDGASGFTTVWDNVVVLIVVVSHESDGVWEIAGWRGVSSDKETGWPEPTLQINFYLRRFRDSHAYNCHTC
jgi:hypothetical protein